MHQLTEHADCVLPIENQVCISLKKNYYPVMSGAKNIFSIISTYPFPYISCGSFEPEKKLSKKEIWLDLIFLSKMWLLQQCQMIYGETVDATSWCGMNEQPLKVSASQSQFSFQNAAKTPLGIGISQTTPPSLYVLGSQFISLRRNNSTPFIRL